MIKLFSLLLVSCALFACTSADPASTGNVAGSGGATVVAVADTGTAGKPLCATADCLDEVAVVTTSTSSSSVVVTTVPTASGFPGGNTGSAGTSGSGGFSGSHR